jgi:hypothetical protein
VNLTQVFLDQLEREAVPKPDAALLTYRVSARWAHEASGSSALASSLYVRHIGSW